MEKEVIGLSDLIGANYRIRLWLFTGYPTICCECQEAKPVDLECSMQRESIIAVCFIVIPLFFLSHLLCYLFVDLDIKDNIDRGIY